MKAQSFD